MTYRIIEDCSPYYIRFDFNGLQDIIEYIRKCQPSHIQNFFGYSHITLSEKSAAEIIKMLPMSDQFSFNTERFAIFDTPPAGGGAPHKDGLDCRVSFNIPVEIADDLCITKWYSEDLFTGFEIQGLPYSRFVVPFGSIDKYPHIKSMIARPSEMVIFNTDIYHSWKNISNNNRKMLTIRLQDKDKPNIYFNDVKRILFNE